MPVLRPSPMNNPGWTAGRAPPAATPSAPGGYGPRIPRSWIPVCSIRRGLKPPKLPPRNRPGQMTGASAYLTESPEGLLHVGDCAMLPVLPRSTPVSPNQRNPVTPRTGRGVSEAPFRALRISLVSPRPVGRKESNVSSMRSRGRTARQVRARRSRIPHVSRQHPPPLEPERSNDSSVHSRMRTARQVRLKFADAKRNREIIEPFFPVHREALKRWREATTRQGR